MPWDLAPCMNLPYSTNQFSFSLIWKSISLLGLTPQTSGSGQCSHNLLQRRVGYILMPFFPHCFFHLKGITMSAVRSWSWQWKNGGSWSWQWKNGGWTAWCNVDGPQKPGTHPLNQDTQCRWAQFFGRFHLIMTFSPGSKNGKPDALFCMHGKEDSTTMSPELIRPSVRPLVS